MRRFLLAILCTCVALGFGLPAAAAAPSGEPGATRIQHCELTIIGQNDDGSYVTTPLTCRRADAAPSAEAPVLGARAGTLATHYSGYNRTGSTLRINGGACSGGWLNLPAGWVNAIASTYSYCAVTHHSSYFQTGATEVVWAPGGNLWSLAYGSASVTYW
jgi:hypothetical protein